MTVIPKEHLGDGILLSFVSVISTAYCASLVWQVVRLKFRDVFANAVVASRGALDFSNTRRADVSVSGIDSKIARLIESRRLQLSRFAINYGAPFFLLALIPVTYTKITDWDFDSEDHEQDILDGHVISMSLAPGMALLCMAFKLQPSDRVRMGLHLFIILRLCWTINNYTSGFLMLADRLACFLARLIMMFAFSGLRMTACLNLLYAIVSIRAFAHHVELDHQILDHLGPRCLMWYTLHEFLASATLIVLSASAFSRMASEARSTVIANSSQAFQEAVTALLHTMYTSVVHLNESLCFASNCEELVSMLLRGNRRSFEGLRFPDLFCDQDRTRVEDFLREDSGYIDDRKFRTIAVPIRVTMKDSLDIPVCVELIESRFQDVDGTTQHLVGIKELGEDIGTDQPTPGRLLNEPRLKPTTSTIAEPLPIQCGKGTAHQASSEDLSCLRSESSTSSTSSTQLLSRVMARTEFAMSTTTNAKTHILFGALMRINIEMKRASCCSYHSVIEDALGVMRALRRKHCFDWDELLGEGYTQCNQCGGISFADLDDAGSHECDICGKIAPVAQTTFVPSVKKVNL